MERSRGSQFILNLTSNSINLGTFWRLEIVLSIREALEHISNTLSVLHGFILQWAAKITCANLMSGFKTSKGKG